MIAKENSAAAREKAAAGLRTVERAGEGSKVAAAAAAGAAGAAAAPEGRASSALGARPSYVPARCRSRRNLLL
jgi:hypothetical protein